MASFHPDISQDSTTDDFVLPHNTNYNIPCDTVYSIYAHNVLLPTFASLSCVCYLYVLWLYFVLKVPVLNRHPTSLAIYKCLFELLFVIQYLWTTIYKGKVYYETFYTDDGLRTPYYCNASTGSAVLAFISQFSLLGSVLCFFILTVDLRKAYTNPFTSFAQNRYQYAVFIVGLSTITATALVLLGPQIYGPSSNGSVWIQRKRITTNPNYVKIALYFSISVLTYIYCLWVIHRYSKYSMKDFGPTLNNRITIMNRATRFVLGFVTFGIIVLLFDFLTSFNFLVPEPNSNGNSNLAAGSLTPTFQPTSSPTSDLNSPTPPNWISSLSAYLYALQGVWAVIVIGFSNWEDLKWENINPFRIEIASPRRSMYEDIAKEGLSMQPHLNSALRTEILYFTTLGIIHASKEFSRHHFASDDDMDDGFDNDSDEHSGKLSSNKPGSHLNVEPIFERKTTLTGTGRDSNGNIGMRLSEFFGDESSCMYAFEDRGISVKNSTSSVSHDGTSSYSLPSQTNKITHSIVSRPGIKSTVHHEELNSSVHSGALNIASVESDMKPQDVLEATPIKGNTGMVNTIPLAADARMELEQLYALQTQIVEKERQSFIEDEIERMMPRDSLRRSLRNSFLGNNRKSVVSESGAGGPVSNPMNGRERRSDASESVSRPLSHPVTRQKVPANTLNENSSTDLSIDNAKEKVDEASVGKKEAMPSEIVAVKNSKTEINSQSVKDNDPNTLNAPIKDAIGSKKGKIDEGIPERSFHFDENFWSGTSDEKSSRVMHPSLDGMGENFGPARAISKGDSDSQLHEQHEPWKDSVDVEFTMQHSRILSNDKSSNGRSTESSENLPPRWEMINPDGKFTENNSHRKGRIPSKLSPFDPDSQRKPNLFTKSLHIIYKKYYETQKYICEVLRYPTRHNYEFKFKDFLPKLFAKVRFMCDISTEEYVNSFRATCKEQFGEGRSGAFMFFSSDQKFIVKTTTKSELLALHRVMPKYVEYLNENPDSFIIRFLGAHCITMYGQELFFVVMKNLFPNVALSERYDLKGSWVNRHGFHGSRKTKTERMKKMSKQSVPLYQDNDLQQKISLQSNIVDSFVDQIFRDIHFLEGMNFMDYSLLIGVKRERFEVIENTKTAKLLGTTSATKRTSLLSHENFYQSRMNNANRPDMLLQFSSIKLSEEEYRRMSRYIGPDTFQRDAMGGMKVKMVEGPGTYYMGIIDILQEWDWKKRLERFYKTYVWFKDPDGISAIQPNKYAERFWQRVVIDTFEGIEDLEDYHILRQAFMEGKSVSEITASLYSRDHSEVKSYHKNKVNYGEDVV